MAVKLLVGEMDGSSVETVDMLFSLSNPVPANLQQVHMCVCVCTCVFVCALVFVCVREGKAACVCARACSAEGLWDLRR